MVRIAVVASFNMDLVMRAERRPSPGQTLQGDFAMYPGGKGFNQAVAARRLDADVSVAGRVGDDEFGRIFLAALDAEGIDRHHVVVDREHGTGVAQIVVTLDGENSIIQSPRANLAVRFDDIEQDPAVTGRTGTRLPPFLTEADAVLCTLETGLPVAVGIGSSLDEYASDHDGSAPLLFFNAAPASLIAGDALPAATIIVNEHEAAALFAMSFPSSPGRTVDPAAITASADDAMEFARLLNAHSNRNCVITLGAPGAVSAAGGKVYAAAPEVQVLDTTGAGDAFCAALAVRTAEGASMADAIRFACAAGAAACTKAGALPSMPYRREVEALFERADW